MRMPLLPHKIILVIGAVVDIAMYSGEEPVTGPDLADRLQLSRRYLEPILQALVRKGILVGVRGARGGYKLAKAPGAISVYDISEAIKTTETEEPSGLLWAIVVPALMQAEQCFVSALRRITVEDLTHSASTQMVPALSTPSLSLSSSDQTTRPQISP
jgi:Rrf2 family protein